MWNGVGDLIVAIDGVAYGLLLYTVAAGLSLCLGVAGVMQLSHGTAYLAGAYAAWALMHGTWVGLLTALAAAIVGGAAAGTGLALLLEAVPRHLDQALATIGVALVGAYVLTEVWGAEPLSVDPPAGLGGSVDIAGRPYPVYRMVFIVIGAGLAAGLWLVVHRTRAGAVMRAVAADPAMVAALGIPPRRMRAAVVAVATAAAAAAGVLGAPVVGPSPGIDHTVLLLSLVIVVAGGAGSTRGALVAAMVVGQIQTTAVAGWPTAAPYLPYAVLALALLGRFGINRRRSA
ncbi:branched-chain amino acid ABC transporter permease [Catellatospora sp. NPDC049133]|uniref:branched-chain amino acid ABC transporter permease n=1 Tax=Catellatospora sp. NPDC049133 TaxID=3155499 RepID=UPI0033FCE41B